MVVGDALAALPFISFDELVKLKEDFGLEALHNSIGVWIDYRPWLNYPQGWSTWVRNMVDLARSVELPIGFTFGYHVADSVTANYSDPIGFLHYYRAILKDKWRYPNGTIAPDPYTVGSSRSFSGYLAIRILGSPLDIERYRRLDFYSTMQPQNPYWLEFFREWGFKAIESGADSFFLDSPDAIFVHVWGGGWGCSDTWEGLRLIEYLVSVLDRDDLSRAGIDDPDKFCLREYLAMRYGSPKIVANPHTFRERFKTSWPPETALFPNTSVVLQDPIFRHALLYWYRSAIEFVANVTQMYKSYASSLDRDIFLTSNTFHAWIPHIMLVPYMDAVQVETSQFKPPPYITYSLACKLGLSSANYSKPVWINEWILNFANPYEPDLPPKDISSLIKYRVAEAYASGCIMLVPFGTGHPSEGWPPRRLVYGSEREEVSAYYRFIRDNKDLFRNVDSLADVAIIASIPTAIWGYIPALNVFSRYDHEIAGWARILETLRIPYDALWIGLDGLFQTSWMDRIYRYKLIIAPHATHISNRDLEILLNYLDSGGVIVATPDFASFDEMNNPRDWRARKIIMDHPNLIVINMTDAGKRFYRSLKDEKEINDQILSYVESIIDRYYADRFIQVEGLNPIGAYLNVLLQPDTGRIIVHLVNYDYAYNSREDWFNPTKEVLVELKIPQVYRVGKVQLYTPDTGSVAEKLNYTAEKGWLRISLPKLNIWHIIVVEPRKYVEETTLTTTVTQTETVVETSTITKTTTYKTTETLVSYITDTVTKTVTSIEIERETETIVKQATITYTETKYISRESISTITRTIEKTATETVARKEARPIETKTITITQIETRADTLPYNNMNMIILTLLGIIINATAITLILIYRKKRTW